MTATLAAFIVFGLLGQCASETVVRCGVDTDAEIAVNTDEPVRLLSAGYPKASLYRDENRDHILSGCTANFSTIEGRNLKIAFINGFHPKKITLSGEESYETVLDTGTDASFPNRHQVFYASSMLVLEVPPSHYYYKWAAFEMLVSSFDANRTSSCAENENVDLSKFSGPVDFGTEWTNGRKADASTCSWTLTAPANNVIKLASKRISLRSGESLTVKTSKEEKQITAANQVFRFPGETKIVVTYHRIGGDVEDVGVLFHASAFQQQAPTSDGCPPQPDPVTFGPLCKESEIVFYGKPTPTLDIAPYSNNQKCSWTFTVAGNYEVRASIRFLPVEIGGDTVNLITDRAHELSPLGLNKFAVEKNSVPQFNVVWQSDENVAMAGFIMEFTAIECTCSQMTLQLTKNVPLRRRSDDTRPLCQDMTCETQIHAPIGYVISFEIPVCQIPNDGDKIEVLDGDQQIALLNVSGPETHRSPKYNSTTNTITIRDTRGHFVDGQARSFYWEAAFTALLLTDISATATESASTDGSTQQECTCSGAVINIPPNEKKLRSSYDALPLCQDMTCETKFFAPEGYVIRVWLPYYGIPYNGDKIELLDGNKQMALLDEPREGEQQESANYTSTTNTVILRETRSHFNGGTGWFFWDGLFTAILPTTDISATATESASTDGSTQQGSSSSEIITSPSAPTETTNVGSTTKHVISLVLLLVIAGGPF